MPQMAKSTHPRAMARLIWKINREFPSRRAENKTDMSVVVEFTLVVIEALRG